MDLYSNIRKNSEISRTVFVCSLNRDSSKVTIRKYFKMFGKVEVVKISAKNPDMRQNTARVVFKSASSAQAVLSNRELVKSQTGFIVDPYLKGESLAQRNVAMSDSRIHVGFIPVEVDDDDLFEIFNQIAPIQICYINKKKGSEVSSLPSNFGFVTFKDKTTAATLIQKGFVKIPSKISSRISIPDYKTAFNQDMLDPIFQTKQSPQGIISVSDIPEPGYLRISSFRVRAQDPV